MPRLRVCAEPDCPTLTTFARCVTHHRARQNTARARSDRNDYGPDWPTIRRRKLAQNPICQNENPPCSSPATVVDHRTPIRHFTVPSAAHHPSNLQSLCKPHHDRKTVLLDGGFGRAPRPHPVG